jgi:hypothetical protein
MEDREKRAMPRLISVNMGLQCDVAWQAKRFDTAIWKLLFQDGAWYDGSISKAMDRRFGEPWRRPSARPSMNYLAVQLGGVGVSPPTAHLLAADFRGDICHRSFDYPGLCGTLSPGPWPGTALARLSTIGLDAPPV